ncbi:MAG TPA: DNA repair protein RecN, partial [Kiloniellaceae bacterium]|nr:DNA repair protein RecN [Kiloniellaceae bacterium]
MLAALSIRDVVLIEKLDLAFDAGLCVLTGETGAGKSILLDALSLTLGCRAETRLLRPGSDKASVTASFELSPAHPIFPQLAELGLDVDADDGELVLRRTLTDEGRSRAYVNDQPISVGLLRGLADGLLEIQGQFEQRGLLDSASHLEHLDAFAGLAEQAASVAAAWADWRKAEEALEAARARLQEARRDEAFLRHACEELVALAPQPGEIGELDEKRQLLRNRDRLLEAMNSALAQLSDEGADSGVVPGLGRSIKVLEGAAARIGGALDETLAALERAESEVAEAVAMLQGLLADMDQEATSLEAVEERYFALQELARKHGCEVEALPALSEDLAARLASLDSGADGLRKLEAASEAARTDYAGQAEALAKKRKSAAARLDKAVTAELKPLKLERARFVTKIERLGEAAWGARGIDRVAFEVSTNPGQAAGPIGKIASGGELARFLLALKVVLSKGDRGRTLVFDEVDSGVGGATADAVGERLARLAEGRQVLVVTHSPQVAARAAHHWQVSKTSRRDSSKTEVRRLAFDDRTEEIARMLSGAKITAEARAAAAKLMAPQ